MDSFVRVLCVCIVQGEGDGEIYEVSVKVCHVHTVLA